MHPSWTRLLVPVFVLCLAPAAALALPEPQEGIALADLFPDATFDPRIPTQEEVLGFRPAVRPMRHAELMQYLGALLEASPRVRMIEYARSHEGRPLVYLAVGDEAVVDDLDGFREAHVRRLDPRGRPAAEDGALLGQVRAVAWMAYGIHGDELSSLDAAAALLYRLVAGQDERSRMLRSELLILIDPCENPDGRERYLAQTTAFAHRRPNPDTEDLSHTTVWPWGRGNHYLFDLNRDWISMVHPESRRVTAIASWHPQLMVDSHEMGSHDSYLFSPSRPPFNPFLPAQNLKWAYRFAADQAVALDERGFPYYTREWNEEFFPGYGSAWAQYIGAVGILYEMSGTEGTLVRQRGAGTRTFAQAVEHQATSSMANLSTLAANREEVLRDFVADRRAAIARAGQGGPAAWVFPRGRNPERVDRLVTLLRAQGIEVLRNTGEPGLSGLRDGRTGEAVPAESLPADLWLVRLDQPSGLLARNLLDPHIPMNAEFFREEREYQERGKGTRLYETTAWSLPLAYDVDAYWTPRSPGAGWTADVPVEEPSGSFESVDDAVAYLIPGSEDRSGPALADLLQRGIQVRIAEKPFRLDGREWDRATMVIRREGNPDDVEAQLAEVAERWKVAVRAVATGRAEEGPDLGGKYFKALVEPRIGVWTGSPVSPGSYGVIWHLLDERLQIRFNGLDVGRFNRVDLSRYNVLIFPSAWGGYGSVLGESGLERLRRWIEAGGTAIGVGNGASFLADERNKITRTRSRRQALDKYPPVVLGISPEDAALAGAFRAAGLRAPAKSKEKSEEDDGKGRGAPATPERSSPYDVAPILGPGAAPFAEGHDQGTPGVMQPVDLADWLKPFLSPGQGKPSAEDLARGDERLRRFMPRGAFLRVELDHDAWLTWGLPEELPALIRARDSFVAEPPVQIAARFVDPERLHLGGLLWPEAAGRLAHTAYATRERKGRGQVILFADDPGFRDWTLGTRRLLVNAILYGPGLGTRWPNPW